VHLTCKAEERFNSMYYILSSEMDKVLRKTWKNKTEGINALTHTVLCWKSIAVPISLYIASQNDDSSLNHPLSCRFCISR